MGHVENQINYCNLRTERMERFGGERRDVDDVLKRF